MFDKNRKGYFIMSKLTDSSEKKYIPYASRRELAVACLLGCTNILLGIIVAYFANIEAAFVAVGFILL